MAQLHQLRVRGRAGQVAIACSCRALLLPVNGWPLLASSDGWAIAEAEQKRGAGDVGGANRAPGSAQSGSGDLFGLDLAADAELSQQQKLIAAAGRSCHIAQIPGIPSVSEQRHKRQQLPQTSRRRPPRSLQLVGRLKRLTRMRRKWAAQHNLTAYRLYERDYPTNH